MPKVIRAFSKFSDRSGPPSTAPVPHGFWFDANDYYHESDISLDDFVALMNNDMEVSEPYYKCDLLDYGNLYLQFHSRH